MQPPVIAAFDFDGTVTYRDSLFPFLIFAAGWAKGLCLLFLDLPYLVGYVFGASSRQGTKERILSRFFRGMQIQELTKLAQEYAKKKLPGQIRPEALEKIRWHHEQGHRCVIVSASIDLYLKPWAEAVGVQDVIGSKLETKENLVTGKLIGANCWGPEKVRRLTETFGDLGQYTLYAYGDSRGDEEMLAVADHPHHLSF